MITQARLKELLHYDPDTGVFTWATTVCSRAAAGRVAGSTDRHGYRVIRADYAIHRAHRLAFLYMTGDVPSIVDHINGIRTDNRWGNLRAADATLNGENRRNAPSGNNPLIGASWNRNAGKWIACITANKQYKYLGLFSTAEEAHQAYLTAKRELHAGCTI